MRFKDLIFRFAEQCPYQGLQAKFRLPNGKEISVMQIPYDIRGKHTITYDLYVDGDEDSRRWLAPKDVDDLLEELSKGDDH